MMIDRKVYKVSIPSDRGIRSGNFMAGYNSGAAYVSIPSDRGIRSGRKRRMMRPKLRESQSPLIGAFVPGINKSYTGTG